LKAYQNLVEFRGIPISKRYRNSEVVAYVTTIRTTYLREAAL
jgi:hypothetical protein